VNIKGEIGFFRCRLGLSSSMLFSRNTCRAVGRPAADWEIADMLGNNANEFYGFDRGK
jgi:hypothetical protein